MIYPYEIINPKFFIMIFFLKRDKFIDLVSYTIDRNMESKVLKTLENDATSRLIEKRPAQGLHI